MAKAVLRGIRGIKFLPYVGGVVDDTSPFYIRHTQQATQEADIEEGETVTWTGSGKNVIVVKDPDKLLGYNITFSDSEFEMDIAAKLIGGTVVREDPEDVQSPIIGWNPPTDPNGIPHVWMEIFIARYIADNAQSGYLRLVLPHVRCGYPQLPEQTETDFIRLDWTAYGTKNPNYDAEGTNEYETIEGPLYYEWVDDLPAELK